MKTNLTKSFVLAFLILIISCTKTYNEVIETKEFTMKHNYVLVSTLDDNEALVEISYSIKGADGQNTVLSNIYTTPIMFGGEDVNVSCNVNQMIVQSGNKKTTKENTNIINRNYGLAGSDHLLIKNLSSTSKLHFCIVANQDLNFYKQNELTGFNLTNITEIDANNVINISPSPIYKNTPILYLLKPELAPNKECYRISAKGGNNEGVKSVSAASVPLLPNHLGDVTYDIPYSINKVLNIYKDHYYNNSKPLFYSYSDLSNYNISAYNGYLLNNDKTTMYGVIEPLQSMTNNGQIWFLNTNLGYYNNDKF